MDIVKIAPLKDFSEACSKTTQELKCPFCGSPFEVAELDATDRQVNSKCIPDDEHGRFKRVVKEIIPIVLRCSECEVELRNIKYIGLFTRFDNYKTTLEQRDIEQWSPKK